MANIGRASNTIDAYGGAVEDHLRFCAVEGTDPVLAGADTVAAWIWDMLDRPRRRSAKALHPETGLANATVQQRVVAVRSFYEYLVEGALRERDPVRRADAVDDLAPGVGLGVSAGGCLAGRDGQQRLDQVPFGVGHVGRGSGARASGSVARVGALRARGPGPCPLILW